MPCPKPCLFLPMCRNDCVAACVYGDDTAINPHIPVLPLPFYGNVLIQNPRPTPLYDIGISQAKISHYPFRAHLCRMKPVNIVYQFIAPTFFRPGICFLSGMQDIDLPSILILFLQLIDMRKLRIWEIQYPLTKFLVHVFLNPRHILSFLPDALHCPGETNIQRIIQQENRITGFQSHFQRPAIIAIDDPFLRRKNLNQPFIEFFPRNVRPVRQVPDHIKVIQRKTGFIPKSPGKGTLPGARASDDNNASHAVIAPVSHRSA